MRWKRLVLADELAKSQRSISVAEFFEKNKHLLGFDSPTRGIITTVKEAVDNALDACEEAEVLPDIYVGIKKISGDVFRIVVEDNGPGIVPEQVPFVFGEFLYGSRFHQIKQSRGQQGIGISAAVLYAQLTTGTPTMVISRTGAGSRAHRFLLQIHIEHNEPRSSATRRSSGTGHTGPAYRSSLKVISLQRKGCSNISAILP